MISTAFGFRAVLRRPEVIPQPYTLNPNLGYPGASLGICTQTLQGPRLVPEVDHANLVLGVGSHQGGTKFDWGVILAYDAASPATRVSAATTPYVAAAAAITVLLIPSCHPYGQQGLTQRSDPIPQWPRANLDFSHVPDKSWVAVHFVRGCRTLFGTASGSFRKVGVPNFGVLIIRILLFRVLYLGPLFSDTPICSPKHSKPRTQT